MKKITTAIIILSALVPALAYAATNVTLTSSRSTATVGQYFTVAISINPSESVYTSKISLAYSSDKIQYSSFTQGANWLPLVQTGYDLVSASTGSIVKTGGYPKGVSTPVNFGTLTFKATKVGTATIAVATGTQILNVNNQNVSSGSANQIQIVIKPAPVATTAINTSSTSTDLSATSSLDETATTSPLVAAAGGTGIAGWILWLLLIILLIAMAIYVYIRMIRPKKEDTHSLN